MVITALFSSHCIATELIKVYVHKDQNGILVFTDKPVPGATLVNLNRNTLTMPATDTSILSQLQAQSEVKAVDYRLSINQPDDKSTIRNNNGVVRIAGQVLPSMKHNHRVRLKLDGKAWQKPHKNTVFILRNIDRGEHSVVLELIDDKNQIVTSSDPVTFFLFRVSAIKTTNSQ
jgi:hypothetical protein